MRLLVSLLGLSGVARAGGRVATRVDVYDDSLTEVVMPSARGWWETAEWSVDGGYAVDVLTSATVALSVDMVSSATTFSEERHQADLGATWRMTADASVGLRATVSEEPDFQSRAGTLTAARELFADMTTLSLATTVGHERLGTVHDPLRHDPTVSLQVDLGWAQILGRSTVAELLVTGGRAWCGPVWGCQASPYRYVPVEADGQVVFAVPETNPRDITRGAVGFKLAQALGTRWALHASGRYYTDSWDVRGPTAELAVHRSLWQDALLLKAQGRFSTQTSALFYEDRYTTDPADPAIPAWRTADRELSGLRSIQAGGRAEWTVYDPGPFLTLRVSGRLARIWYAYPWFEEMPERQAWLVGGGVDAEL